MFKDFDFLLLAFCFMFFVLFLGFSFALDARMTKLELLHENYSVCTECGNISIKE